jgi:hypothetical protein
MRSAAANMQRFIVCLAFFSVFMGVMVILHTSEPELSNFYLDKIYSREKISTIPTSPLNLNLENIWSMGDYSNGSSFVCDDQSWWDDSSRPRFILYWNEAYGSTKYGFCCGKQPFVENK